MQKIIKDFLTEITSFSNSIKEEVDAVNKYWSPSEPPIIMLFARVGRKLVSIYPELDDNAKKNIFQYIEYGITSDNDDLATAVATGLIEAMVTTTDDYPSLWKQFEKLLGKASKEHALAWRNFGQ